MSDRARILVVDDEMGPRESLRMILKPRHDIATADSGEAALRASLARAVETGKPDALAVQRYPIWVKLPNGEMRYEERLWATVSTPLFGEDGKVLCISHTTRDVTEQVRAADQ